MGVDKGQIGILFPTKKKLPLARQEAALRAHGAQDIVTVSRQLPWRKIVESGVRAGDTVRVLALVLLATERGKDKLTPAAQIGAFIAMVHARGASVLEVYTGRNSAKDRDCEGMIADAVNALRTGSRALPPGHAKRGRRRLEFTPEQTAQARAAWFDVRYITNKEAGAHMPEGFTKERAFKLFGGSGRPFPKRKAKR